MGKKSDDVMGHVIEDEIALKPTLSRARKRVTRPSVSGGTVGTRKRSVVSTCYKNVVILRDPCRKPVYVIDDKEFSVETDALALDLCPPGHFTLRKSTAQERSLVKKKFPKLKPALKKWFIIHNI